MSVDDRRKHNSAYVDVGPDEAVKKDNMRATFQAYLMKLHNEEDGTSDEHPNSRQASHSAKFSRSTSLLQRFKTRPDIGHILDIDLAFKDELPVQPVGKESRQTSLLMLKNTETRWGYVFNPTNLWRQMWDLICVTLCLIYSALRVPFVIAFDIDEFADINGWFIMNRIVDFVFLADIVVIFLTAYQDGRHFVVKYKLIAWKYATTWLLMDLVSSIPLDLIIWSNHSGNSNTARGTKLFRVVKIMRTLRILRLFKLKRVLLAVEMFLNLNFSMMSIFKFFCGIVLSAHLIACGFLFIGFEEEDGWLAEPNSGVTTFEQYIASLYWAFTTMATIGYGDIRAVTANERIFATFCMIFGGVMFTYGVTRVVGIVSTMGKSKINLLNQLESLNEWAQYHDLSQQLIGDIKTYLHYKNTQMYYDEDSIMKSLSIPLQKRILKQMYSKQMEQIELFKSIKNKSFLSEIMLRLRSEFAQPHQIICKEGDVADSMYMIRKGIAAAFQGKHVKDIRSALLLTSGQGFDEIALLADNVLRTASVVSLDWCDLGFLTKHDFASLVAYFPKQRKLLEDFALEKIEEYKFAIKGRHQRMPKVSEWSSGLADNKIVQQQTGVNEFLQWSHNNKTDSDGRIIRESIQEMINLNSADDPEESTQEIKCNIRSDISSEHTFDDTSEDNQDQMPELRTVASVASGTVSNLLRDSVHDAHLRRNEREQVDKDFSLEVLGYLKSIEAQVRTNTETITNHIESITAPSRQLTVDNDLSAQDKIPNLIMQSTLLRPHSSVPEEPEQPETKEECKQ